MRKESAKGDSGLYPIKTAASITGVNANTLRAWERRYGLIQPQRSGGKYRLYTRDDLDLINKVVSLLEKGIPIGRVQEALVKKSSSAAAQSTSPWAPLIQRMVRGVIQLDEDVLDAVYNEALSLYPIDVVTQALMVPVMTELGERWASDTGTISEEHFFTVYLRNQLGARFHHLRGSSHRQRLIAACLPGELHENGLLFFALAALAHGHRVKLLGANMPLKELPTAIRKCNADGVVLAGVMESSFSDNRQDLRALVAQLSEPVFVGGSVAMEHWDEIINLGGTPLEGEINRALTRIDNQFALNQEDRNSASTEAQA